MSWWVPVEGSGRFSGLKEHCIRGVEQEKRSYRYPFIVSRPQDHFDACIPKRARNGKRGLLLPSQFAWRFVLMEVEKVPVKNGFHFIGGTIVKSILGSHGTEST
jgi:hypothetical protein